MSLAKSKFTTIIKHEYITRVKSKGFIIGTLIGPLGIVLFIGIIALATYISVTDTPDKRIAIIDATGIFGQDIVQSEPDKFYMAKDSEQELRKQVLNGKIDGFIILDKDILKNGIATLYTSGGGTISMLSVIEKRVAKVVRHQRLIESGVDESVIRLVDKGVDIHTQKITKEGIKKDYAEIYAGLGYILGFVIYIMMLSYGGIVMRGVIEEKANRIIEIIASSAKPFDIMMGKVVGIGAVGLTQVLIWVILGMILLLVGAPVLEIFTKSSQVPGSQMIGGMQNSPLPPGFEIPPISPWLIIGFIFYFLSGYFLYATLFAAIGSAVDQESDAAQLQMPVTILIIIPMLFISVIISNPEGLIATILSLIPFFSPMLMIIRAAASDVPIWQFALSAVLMIATFFTAIWLASKIYRVGILMYGKKPSFKDLIRWVKVS